MPSYFHKFAMRCSEQQWSTSVIGDVTLSQKLVSLGYDLSELKFLPNMPFVATQYKGIQSKIGSTNTPFKEDRHVIDEWNAELFYALCCQQETPGISVGEFFTDKDGAARECTRVDDKWVIHDYAGGKNDAFPKAQCQKSSYENLVSYYLGTRRLNVESEEEQIGFIVTTGVIQSADIKTEFDQPPIDTSTSLTGPLSFKQILHCFGEGNDVVEGTIEDGEIKCKVHQIDGVSRDSILFVGSDKGVPFNNIYKNKESFLLHALTILKSQA